MHERNTMASNCTQADPLIKNLNTSLAYLTPPQAAQIEGTRFLYVASLSAFIWDMLFSLGQDYRLLTQYPINLPTIVYFASRLSSLAFVTTGTLFYAAPVGSCQELTTTIGWCWAVSAPLTSLLFFFRARAVFDKNRVMIAIFCILWLATLGGSISVPFSISGDHIAETDRCLNTSFLPSSSAGIVASTFNDTFIFIAISWRVITFTAIDGKIKSFVSARNLPYVSRELIQGGQQYYLVTVVMNVVTLVLILTKASTSPLISAMFIVPSKALENVMACRVFRDIKLNAITPDSHTSASLTERRPPSSAIIPSFPLHTFERSLKSAENRLPRDPGVVQIRKTVEQFEERDSVHDVMPDQHKAGPLQGNEDEFV